MNTSQIVLKIIESGKPLTGSGLTIGEKNSYIELGSKMQYLTPTEIQPGYYDLKGDKVADFIRGDIATFDSLMKKGSQFYRINFDKMQEEYIIVQFN